MYIVPSEIEKYCKKVGDEIHVEVDLDDKKVVFRFVRGRYEMYGSTAVLLTGQEISELLELNSVLGENGEVKRIINSEELDKDNKVHDLIYTTLGKYVVQMLNAAMGKDYFPDIEALPQHSEIYFRRVGASSLEWLKAKVFFVF